MRREVLFYYFNDRHADAYIRTMESEDIVTLKPATGKLFKLHLPMNEIPFVKVWETNVILIAGIDADIAKEMDEQD